MAIQLVENAAKGESRTRAACHPVGRGMVKVAHPDANDVLVVIAHDPCVAVIGRGARLDRGLQGHVQNAAGPEFQLPRPWVGQDVADKRRRLFRPYPLFLMSARVVHEVSQRAVYTAPGDRGEPLHHLQQRHLPVAERKTLVVNLSAAVEACEAHAVQRRKVFFRADVIDGQKRGDVERI